MAVERKSGFMRLTSLLERFVRSPIPGTMMGYDSGDPQGRTVQGDDNFPFFKDPADLDESRIYFRPEAPGEEEEDPIPVATSLAELRTLGAIDVRGFRTLTLFVNYRSCAEGDESLARSLEPVFRRDKRAVVRIALGRRLDGVAHKIDDPARHGEKSLPHRSRLSSQSTTPFARNNPRTSPRSPCQPRLMGAGGSSQRTTGGGGGFSRFARRMTTSELTATPSE